MNIVLSNLILSTAILTLPLSAQVQWELMQNECAHITHGFNIRLKMNGLGNMGLESNFDSLAGRFGGQKYIPFGLQYPLTPWIEHLYAGGLWIGAKMNHPNTPHRSVSTTYAGGCSAPEQCGGYICETWPDSSRGDRIFQTSILDQNEPNRRFYDEDGDGQIDEDELDGLDNDGDWLRIRDDLNHNGKPDHGEPNVDEDYGAISEMDTYITYRDSLSRWNVYGHTPLNVKVIQRAYAWKDRVKEPIMPIEYSIVNEGIYTLDSVYVGLSFNPLVRAVKCLEVSIGCDPWLITHQLPGYFNDIRTIYIQNFTEIPSTPLGVTLLGASGGLEDKTITYRWYNATPRPEHIPYPLNDDSKYQLMASGVIDKDIPPEEVENNSLMQIFFFVGPFRSLKTGDTAHVAFAFVSGQYLETFPNNIRDNAAKAIDLYNQHWVLPSVPPSPKLRLIPGDNRVRLDWSRLPGDLSPDPMDVWDESNNILNALPDTHWRKRNPPPGMSKGGRVFEGFRVWRSEYPVLQERQFTLLRQFDVDDDLGFEGQTGIRFSFTDSLVVRGKSYRYAVTSFTIPDYTIVEYPNPGGGTIIDTLRTNPVESELHENVTSYQVPFAVSRSLGEVKVVPNPYRTDMNYSYEGGGWEGLARNWVETQRLVWFIHLPSRCTLRIFALGGEVVKTIEHDDAERVSNGLPIGQEEFYLLSESNRALASGIYVFTVESEYGRQIGKFVIIR